MTETVWCPKCRTRVDVDETFPEALHEREGDTGTREVVVTVTRLVCGHQLTAPTGEVHHS